VGAISLLGAHWLHSPDGDQPTHSWAGVYAASLVGPGVVRVLPIVVEVVADPDE
jgi:hypothetical protein